MHCYSYCLLLFIVSFVNCERDLFVGKCSRKCDSRLGTDDCWKRTTNSFAYGLSTALVDYCQLIRHLDSNQWLNTTKTILFQQIDKYDLNPKVRQLKKSDIQDLSLLLIHQCFQSFAPLSSQPSCPSCTIKQIQSISEWRYLSITFLSISFALFLVILFLFFIHNRRTRLSYHVVN